MRILQLRILSGPNLYSLKPVMWLQVDLERYADMPSHMAPGFIERLLKWLPELASHRCSVGVAGGFVQRLREGTYPAHILEHVILALQNLAGDDIGFGKARATRESNVYDVIVGYQCPEVARASAAAALDLLLAAFGGRPFDREACLAAIADAGARARLGPSTNAIYEAALARRIPARRLAGEDFLLLGYGKYCRKIWAAVSCRTSLLAADLACDKRLTTRLLRENGLPAPQNAAVDTAAKACAVWEEWGRPPVVVKPLAGSQGRGVTVDIRTPAQIGRAMAIAAAYGREVLIERFVPGREYRFCVVNGKLAAAAERIPAHVVGDGVRGVAALVEAVNRDPRRGDGHDKPLTRIRIDAVAVTVLAKQGLTPDDVPAKGRRVYIREGANLSTGGTAADVTDRVHPANIRLAERAAAVVGLDIAGVDLIARDISRPLTAENGAIIEVNAAPGIRMHHYPSAGPARDVAGRIVEYLCPEREGRIPILAVTGTNGKTTVVRMIACIWQGAGYRVGMTTTGGVYIDGRCVLEGDMTGPSSARMVLADTSVDVAVLETARGGMLRGGLAFDRCDVSVVTNVTEDHLGQDGIEDLEDLAYVKALLLEVVRPGGSALINADDPYAALLAGRVKEPPVYFSMAADNPRIRRHLGVGGRAFFIKDGAIVDARGARAAVLAAAGDIPATLGGCARHNLQNALIAAAACACAGLSAGLIRRGLAGFVENPGRLKLLAVRDFFVCVDYGHNPAGFQALIDTARRLNKRRLIGVIGAPGDRRDDVTIHIGEIAGRGFDLLFIKEDSDRRGRAAGATAALLRRGALAAGFDEKDLEIVLPEAEALRRALRKARRNDLVIVFYEQYELVLEVIRQFAAAGAAAAGAKMG